MEQIPGSGTQAQKLLFLSPLGFWRVSSGPERSIRGACARGQGRIGSVVRLRTMTQWRASVILFVFTAGTTTGSALRWVHCRLRRWGGVGTHRPSIRLGHGGLWTITDARRGGSRGLVASIVNYTRQQLLAATRQLLDGFFGRAIFSGPVGGLCGTGGNSRGRHGRQIVGLRRIRAGCALIIRGAIRLPVTGTQCLGPEDV